MFGHLNLAELAVLVAEKLNAYRQEAELERQLPRHALRHRIAWQLRAWALALEPSAEGCPQQKRGSPWRSP